MDALHFSRGSPDVLHSDDAPEFLSDLLTAISAITGTARTTTRGHNPQSNGEIESWWRYWNRAMRYLSPSQYFHWPLYAQRIVFAYNSVSHESIGNLSPFEMDFASPAKSPFAPPDPDLTFPDLEGPPTQELSPVSPEVYIAALRVSVHAFHTFAATHKTFVERLSITCLNI
jgi:hypothetical protein